jgi:outer membrane protein W
MKYFLLTFLFSVNAYAGFIEVGASVNIRDNSVDEQNKSKTRSVTGSIAYYFFENSAFEISYTEGYVKTESTGLVGGVSIPYTQIVNFQMISGDFILSFGAKNDAFQPYIKAGMAYQEKEIQFQANGSDSSDFPEVKGEYVTGGIGFKILLGKNWSFKAGYDMWKGPLGEEDQTTDAAVRAGISFMF